VSVSRVFSPLPMFTVAPGVTMTSWSVTTAWSGLPEVVPFSRYTPGQGR
jgi:hypothetical protein